MCWLLSVFHVIIYLILKWDSIIIILIINRVIKKTGKAMAPHSGTLAWKIPWMEEPGGLQSMGSLRVKTRLSDFTFTFHFHALEKEMATHSSVLAWRIPGTGEPDGLPSMGSHRVGHDWSDLAAIKKRMLRNFAKVKHQVSDKLVFDNRDNTKQSSLRTMFCCERRKTCGSNGFEQQVYF